MSDKAAAIRIYKNAQGRRVTIPFHSGAILHPKRLRSILRDAELTIEEFQALQR